MSERDFGGDVHPDIEYGLMDPVPTDHMAAFEYAEKPEATVRPAWMSRLQWIVHCIGLCSKERKGYACKALSPDECPGRPRT